MAERITSLDEVKDPEGFLKAHYEALEDLVTLRNDLKTLQGELDAAKEMASPENMEKWKDRAVKQAVKSALEGEGIKNAERVLKYMKLDGIDFDDNDSLTGLDDKLSEVKTDFPELFDAKRRAGRESVDIHARTPAKAPMSGTEAQVARIFKSA